MATTSSVAPKIVRCAIYTRKSTEEGLDQNFNSLDAQRDAGEAYIRSQAGEGWTCLAAQYDDGGYTGANMDRPALKRLLADSEAGRIDCVVVYKVDRLSRSIRDFAKIMEVFEKHGTTFVSVTQQFNTTTSLGRLTRSTSFYRSRSSSGRSSRNGRRTSNRPPGRGASGRAAILSWVTTSTRPIAAWSSIQV